MNSVYSCSLRLFRTSWPTLHAFFPNLLQNLMFISLSISICCKFSNIHRSIAHSRLFWLVFLRFLLFAVSEMVFPNRDTFLTHFVYEVSIHSPKLLATLKKTRLKITQLEKARFIKVNELEVKPLNKLFTVTITCCCFSISSCCSFLFFF